MLIHRLTRSLAIAISTMVITLGCVQAEPVSESMVTPDSDGVIRLTPAKAKLSGKQSIVQRHGEPQIHNWTNPRDTVSWEFQAAESGTYQVKIVTASLKSGAVIIGTGIGKLACSVPETDDLKTFKILKMGQVELEEGKTAKLLLQPVVDGWSPVSIRRVELVRID